MSEYLERGASGQGLGPLGAASRRAAASLANEETLNKERSVVTDSWLGDRRILLGRPPPGAFDEAAAKGFPAIGFQHVVEDVHVRFVYERGPIDRAPPP